MADIEYPVNRSDANDPEPDNPHDTIRERQENPRAVPARDTRHGSMERAPSETAVRISMEALQRLTRAEKDSVAEKKTLSSEVMSSFTSRE